MLHEFLKLFALVFTLNVKIMRDGLRSTYLFVFMKLAYDLVISFFNLIAIGFMVIAESY